MRQITMLAQILAQVLAQVLGLTKAGQHEQALAAINEAVQRMLGLDLDAVGKLSASGLLTTITLGEGADNGAGHNALVQTYLRAGSYRVAVSAKESNGRAGLLATPAVMVTTGVLSPDGSVRATLADGVRFRTRFTDRLAGRQVRHEEGVLVVVAGLPDVGLAEDGDAVERRTEGHQAEA